MSERSKSENVSNNWKYATIFLAGILFLGVVIFIANQGNIITGNVVKTKNDAQPSTTLAKISTEGQPMLGSKTAKVTVVELSDSQCPFCRKFWTETYPQVKKEYIDTGKVKWVYRDFPLDSIHPAATPSAIAAECVRKQGGDDAFWKMHGKIFEEQNILDSGNAKGPVTRTVQYSSVELKAWAADIGYNIDACLDSNEFLSEVKKDLSDGQVSGARGTPTFFINNKLLSGAQPYSAFKAAIDAELSQ